MMSLKYQFEVFVRSRACSYSLDRSTWGLKYTTAQTQAAFEAFEFQQKQIAQLRHAVELLATESGTLTAIMSTVPNEEFARVSQSHETAVKYFRDLHIKLEGLEVSSETIYLTRRKGQDDFISCTKERFDELASNSLFEVMTCKQQLK